MAGKGRGTGILKALAIAGAIAIFALALVIMAAQPAGDFGTLAGKVFIGPLCPVEPCHANTDVYASRKVVATPADPLRGPYYISIDSEGAYSSMLPAGTYSVSITDCTFLGCGRALPREAAIRSGKTTALDIEIDTGIR